ncbi:ATP-binding protein, partial [Pseudomonas sp. MOB-449]|nr:ATP-binding protein [Pseudomonas sp. MOB-449]
VKDALDMHRGVAEGKGLALEEQVAAGLPASLCNDRKRVLQILSNLLHNALKFTTEGYVRLSLRRDGDTLCFAVADSGPGI